CVDLDVEAEVVEEAHLLGEEDIHLAGAGRVAIARDVGDGAGVAVALALRLAEERVARLSRFGVTGSTRQHWSGGSECAGHGYCAALCTAGKKSIHGRFLPRAGSVIGWQAKANTVKIEYSTLSVRRMDRGRPPVLGCT